MRLLTIRPIQSAARRGDFDGTIDESGLALELPEQIASSLKSHGVRTAGEMVSYIEAFPSAIAAELQWTVPDVLRGLENLRKKLRGHVDDAVLNPSTREQHSFGAMNPATYKRTIN
jgi:hypothetical protein